MVVTNEEVPSPTSDGVETCSVTSQQQASSSVRHVEHCNDKDSKMENLKKDRDSNKKRQREKQRKSTNPRIWRKSMDPEVWGNLPPNLTLEIYKKLPMRNFYQLREVCKDWNLVARERRCVTDPIHKPYFVLIHGPDELDNDNGLHGILTFHIKSGSWRWKKLHAISFRQRLLYQPFSVKGLTLSCPKGRQYYQVFDTHARKRCNIPLQPKTVKMSCAALGMTVDTSGFKIILGSLDIGTQIYDSVTKSWETRSSHLVPCNLEWMYGLKTCLHCGDYMYIWAQLDKILTYSLQEDKWGTLDPPPRNPSDSNWRGLGSWEGRLFTVSCDGDATLGAWTSDDEDDSCIAPLLWVWELVDQTLWKKVDEMPGDMQRWLTPLRIHDYKDIEIHANFSDSEHVLIYSWVPEAARAFRFVLYNVATKTWEKVEVPNHSVSILPDDERDTERWDLEDMYSMQLEDAFQEAQEMGQGDLFAQGLLHCLSGGFGIRHF